MQTLTQANMQVISCTLLSNYSFPLLQTTYTLRREILPTPSHHCLYGYFTLYYLYMYFIGFSDVSCTS